MGYPLPNITVLASTQTKRQTKIVVVLWKKLAIKYIFLCEPNCTVIGREERSFAFLHKWWQIIGKDANSANVGQWPSSKVDNAPDATHQNIHASGSALLNVTQPRKIPVQVKFFPRVGYINLLIFWNSDTNHYWALLNSALMGHGEHLTWWNIEVWFWNQTYPAQP